MLRAGAVGAYEAKRDRLSSELAAARAEGAAIALKKSTSNLFRRRDQRGTRKIDVRDFNRVLRVAPDRLVADVEGMTTYEALVNETLRYGLLPAVVPQLKTITVGGAVSGLGIESSSFRFGLVHETIEEMEILLADGGIVPCSRTENADLFYGFANSYGTLGYALRLKLRLIAARPLVRLTHQRFVHAADYFAGMARLAASGEPDYLDGTMFGPQEMYVTVSQFVDTAPFVSDYTYRRIYYRSLREEQTDYLTAKDYIWRWDTDWFWCSRHFGAQHPVLRLLVGKWALNSKTYQRLMRLSQRMLPDSGRTESVIQDVDIPSCHAVEFAGFLLREIGITPVWVCPFRVLETFDLYALDPQVLYINFGFWDTVRAGPEPGHYNRLIERKACELNGKKGLYSTAWYDEDTFWRIYNRERYAALKRKYDPRGVFLGLYEKCVGKK